jgi:hypothetical protein
MVRLGPAIRSKCCAAMACAPWRKTGFSWLLVAAVAMHAAISPAANWALAAACQSEEEPEPRETPAEEEVAGVFGATPSRGYGMNRARSLLLAAWRAERMQRKGHSSFPRHLLTAELGSRNGCGAPLRC